MEGGCPQPPLCQGCAWDALRRSRTPAHGEEGARHNGGRMLAMP